jgi:hypothetical protein
MKDADKFYNQLKNEQVSREGDLLSNLLASSEELKNLAGLEADLSVRRNEILFKVQVQIEDTTSQLKQAEQLVERLKKHLSQLEGLHRILTKQ